MPAAPLDSRQEDFVEGLKWGILTHTQRRQPSAAERRNRPLAALGDSLEF
jgi:hypothetical protein